MQADLGEPAIHVRDPSRSYGDVHAVRGVSGFVTALVRQARDYEPVEQMVGGASGGSLLYGNVVSVPG
jgi:hypothetical protein